jgi:uncharacterized protein (DUF2461 family)
LADQRTAGQKLVESFAVDDPWGSAQTAVDLEQRLDALAHAGLGIRVLDQAEPGLRERQTLPEETNNDKDWFDTHRDEIHQAAVLPLTAVREQASKELSRTHLPMSGGSKTLFRIHRDTRFSQNRVPYKTQVSGPLTPDGSKSANEGGRVPSARQTVATCPDQFRAVLNALGKANLELTREMSLTAMLRGYSQYAGEWFAEYVKFKVFLVRTRLSKEVWANGKIVSAFVDQTLKCSSLIRFGQSNASSTIAGPSRASSS